MDKLCTFGADCKNFHGPFTKAMWEAKKKRDAADKANTENQKALAASKTEERSSDNADTEAKPPKAKAKAKP